MLLELASLAAPRLLPPLSPAPLSLQLKSMRGRELGLTTSYTSPLQRDDDGVVSFMRWTRYQVNSGGEPLPSARCGHCAARVHSTVWDGTLIVIFGGSSDKQFLNDTCVLHLENGLWSRPVVGVGPSPRAFHCCAALGTDVYYFGGRTGGRRHSDAWKLDTNTWEWTQLRFENGVKPDVREKADCIALDDNRILLFGGYDGIRWLNEVYILHVEELEWTMLKLSGPLPPPRSGHKLVMIQHRMLLFGGETAGGQYLSDLWALKGLFGEESPRWVRMQLAGAQPSGRTGHSFTSVGTKLIGFGGQGDEGWLAKKEVYHRDVCVIDRETVRWIKPPEFTTGPQPSERALHSVTMMDATRLLMLGGWNGKTTNGEGWILELTGDSFPPEAPDAAPRARLQEAASTPPLGPTPPSGRKSFDPTFGLFGSLGKAKVPVEKVASVGWMQMSSRNGTGDSKTDKALKALRQRLNLPEDGGAGDLGPSATNKDALLVHIGSRLDPGGVGQSGDVNNEAALARVRSYYSSAGPEDLSMLELEGLLYDYQCVFPKGVAAMRARGEYAMDFGRFLHVPFEDMELALVGDLLTKYKALLSASVQ